MSGLLKDVMNKRAEAAERPHLDLDAIVATGEKRIRRHRVAAAVATTAAVATIAVAAATVVDTDQRSTPDGIQPATSPAKFEQRTTTYSAGSVIHHGDQQIDVAPHSITSFVQTDDGFVFTDSRRWRLHGRRQLCRRDRGDRPALRRRCSLPETMAPT
ncbi:MAG: hypothetical protein WKF76_12185 [Nocardioidaceae bacterium]